MNNDNIRKLSMLIICFSGFQQFPVLRLGGSFRIYELMACLILSIIIAGGKFIVRSRDFPAIFFFVVSPLISAIIGYCSLEPQILNEYYEQFPSAVDEVRYSPIVAILFPTFYYFLSGIAYLSISNLNFSPVEKRRNIRLLIFISSFIATNSIITSFLNGFLHLPGVVQMLPNYIQNVGHVGYGFRSSGLSQEPSFFIYYQAWIVFIIWYFRTHLSKLIFPLVFFINIFSLMLTLSSALLGFFASIVIVALIRFRFLYRLFFIAFICGIFVISFFILNELALLQYAEYFLVTKIQNFFTAPIHTLDSGAFRSFTNTLGIYIFRDHWLFGVGPGASIFYMPSYEQFAGIEIYGERLSPGSFPQNTYSSVLAELGVFGFIPMLILLFKELVYFFRVSKLNYESTAFFSGVFFTILSLLSIAPAYSMFIWVPIALGKQIIFERRFDCK